MKDDRIAITVAIAITAGLSKVLLVAFRGPPWIAKAGGIDCHGFHWIAMDRSRPQWTAMSISITIANYQCNWHFKHILVQRTPWTAIDHHGHPWSAKNSDGVQRALVDCNRL